MRHSASAWFAYASLASKAAALGSGNPAGHPLTSQALPAPQHARKAEARKTRGMHEGEQCMGIAEGFEERACEREHVGRRGAGASHRAMRKCHEGAGRNFLGELCKGILLHNYAYNVQ